MSKRNCWPGAEAAQHFVVLAAMAQAKVDDLAPVSLARNLQRLPDLPIGMVAVLVKQRGRDLHFERLLVEQIDDCLRGRDRLALHQLARRLPQLAPGFHLIRIRVRILHQRRRDSNLMQQLLLGPRAQLRIHRPNLLHQIPQRLGIHVVGRAGRRLLQRLA